MRGACLIALALLIAALAVTLAAAQSPAPGGTVPSLLSLSLGEPTPAKPAATLRAEVTATDSPAQLSLPDAPALKRWRAPVSRAAVQIHLRPEASKHQLVITLAAAGP